MGFTPPPYPYDRVDAIRDLAVARFGSAIDCTIGTPCDPPPQAVIDRLGSSGLERGYPTSVGSPELRSSIAAYLARRLQVSVAPDDLAICMGTKEFVASTAYYLHLRDPEKDTVLYPTISYPTYAMSATLAGLRAVPVALDAQGRLDLTSISSDDADRAQCLWSNSPMNPTGSLDDLGAVAEWGRAHGVPVLSDECYAEFTWQDRPRTILEHGADGVLAVHSVSKRSNLAGMRCGFYAGDRELVTFLRSVRQHAGAMVPGPVQAAVTVAYDDDAHVDAQRALYAGRIARTVEAFAAAGFACPAPEGAFYCWIPVPERFTDAWHFAQFLAEATGIIVSPGDLYGPTGAGAVRLAVVVPDAEFDVGLARLAG